MPQQLPRMRIDTYRNLDLVQQHLKTRLHVVTPASLSTGVGNNVPSLGLPMFKSSNA